VADHAAAKHHRRLGEDADPGQAEPEGAEPLAGGPGEAPVQELPRAIPNRKMARMVVKM
jgi:hypothetical protein